MFCLFIWQEELDTSLGLLTTGQALELIPSQVQYVYINISNNLNITRCVLYTAGFPPPTGGGRYIPGSDPNPSAPAGVADPFTGELLRIPSWQLFSGRHVQISLVCKWYEEVVFVWGFFYPLSVTLIWIILLSALQAEAHTPQQPSDRRQPTSTSPRLMVWPLSKPVLHRSLVRILSMGAMPIRLATFSYLYLIF